MNRLPLTLKGTPQGLLLQPRTDDWEELLAALAGSLRQAEGFFRGGRVFLELEPQQQLTVVQMEALRSLLEEHELLLDAVLGGDAATQKLARSHGLRTRLPTSTARAPVETAGEALYEQRTLRSGQSLHFPGHVTLVGDVNPGAEIVAGGNVVIWGRARGVIHAGALGNRAATICALDLNPAQLRIADLITRPPEGSRRGAPHPEVARIRDRAIVVESWTARGE
ncbi:MAG: septum site-determining protein MinC [Anaerolineales bacterium]